jgi:hypothetical protein
MLNVTEDDLSRLFDRMVEAVDAYAISDEQCTEILRELALQMVTLGWDELGLPSGGFARSIKKHENKPWAVLALRLADPEPEILDSHTGVVSWLGYSETERAWVLRIPSRETWHAAPPTVDGWNDLVRKWLKAMDSELDYLDGYERYAI